MPNISLKPRGGVKVISALSHLLKEMTGYTAQARNVH